MENEEKVKFKTYGTKQAFSEGILINRGKNLLIISEVRDRKTGELIKEEHKIVYEKYVQSTVEYCLKNYDDNMVYYPESNKEIVIIMKSVKPDVEDDIFTVKTAQGKTKREIIDLRN